MLRFLGGPIRIITAAHAVTVVALSLCIAPVSEGQPALPAIRDSAGTRIVVHRSLAGAPVAFDLAPPSLSVGGLRENPDEELNSRHPFLAPVRLSDGRIAVADWSSIKFYAANGAFLRSAGRRGGGPGEFGQLRRICRLPGDTLLAMGYSDRRLSLWSADGVFIREMAPLGVGASEPCFADGTLLMVARPARGAAASSGTAQFVRVSIAGLELSRVGELPVEQYDLPYFRPVSVVAHGDSIFSADGKTFEIRTHSANGRLLRILRVTEVPARIPDDRWREMLDNSPPPIRARAQSLTPRPRYPAFAEVRADPAGRLWVHDYLDRRRWIVFAANGSLLGTVTVPEFGGRVAIVAAFEHDAVVLLYSDDNGAAVLSWHRLVPAARVTPKRPHAVTGRLKR